MTKLAQTLRAIIGILPHERPFALVGGLAVSARAEPRFTRDIDLAIGVTGDGDAEAVVYALRERFSLVAAIEHTTARRLATVRLRESPRAPIVDLLFASCGIEAEVAAEATRLDILGATVPVATTGHLIAMKLVSRDAKRRPRDQQDLVDLAAVASEVEWDRATRSIAVIAQRGFSRGRDLAAGLAEIRALVVP